MNKLPLLLLLTLFVSFQAVSQNAKYDLRFKIHQIDCHWNTVVFDLEIKAESPTTHFNLADLNIRFSFGNALANPTILQELDVSGVIFNQQHASFYDPHHLNGSNNNIVSYNVPLAGGDGYPIEDVNYVPIGRMSFDIVDISLPLHLDFLSQLNGDFPTTAITEKYNNTYGVAQEAILHDHLDLNYCGYNNGAKIRPKLFLEGPFNSSTREMAIGMNNSGLVPLVQPYAALGMHFGTETTTAAIITNHNIVDWVLVQIRKATDSTVVLGTIAGLLDNEGNVTDVDGQSPILVSQYSQNAFVSIVHRNHLSIMTAQSIDMLYLTITPVDFTTIPLFGNNSTKIDDGKQIMWAGDSDTNGSVNAGDRSNVWNDRNQAQYLRTDLTLDGVVNAADRSVGWNNRNLTAQKP